MQTTQKLFRRVEYKIPAQELGLHFVDDEFKEVLKPGTYRYFDPKNEHRVEAVSQLAPWLHHPKLDELVFSGKLKGLAEVIDLNDDLRGLVWVDGRFDRILEPGVHAYWIGPREVEVQIVEAATIRFQHPALPLISQSPSGKKSLIQMSVSPHHVALLYYNGVFAETLPPGPYAFWRNVDDVRLYNIDMREQTVDITGQELMTADKVTLRMNAIFGYRVVDPVRMEQAVDNIQQTLYRETQLVLRNVVGRRELDQFLSDKNEIAVEAEQSLKDRAEALGVKVLSFGIRDVILPGDMKELLNKVTEAKKAAEANLIARREETAARRPPRCGARRTRRNCSKTTRR